ncbi:ABC transporter family protein [Paraburkholderia sp. BL9I2N2]|nr:ABC transporter family protein [Paraburkholderia sp. BL9I2N2]
MVEIAKAVSFDSDVLIMDEPTSALTEHEVGHLFRIIRDLKSRGKGIVYITHKMNELYEIADEVSVFRDGRFIDTRLTKDITRDQIIQMMVGREVTQMFPKMEVPIADVVLKVDKLAVEGIFHDVSFEVRAGEIFGFAGLVGSGRSNVAEALFGVVPATEGSITIEGKLVKVDSPSVAMRQPNQLHLPR